MLRADDSSCSFCDIELNLYLTCSSNWGRELLLRVRIRGLVFYLNKKSSWKEIVLFFTRVFMKLLSI